MASSGFSTEQRMVWAFWLACGLAVIAGVVPLVFGGGGNRIGGVVIPFVLAAVLLGACALLYTQGRPIATLLYFLASLAIVYGILAMLTLPLRLAVLGTCPPAPAACTSGLERPMTSGESTALGLAVGLGIVAILTGFFGLVTLYRRETNAHVPYSAPPVRRIAPVGEKTQAPVEAVATEPPAPAEPDATPVAVETEPAPEAMLELEAPVEPLELPAVGTADPTDPTQVAAPAPERKPRRRRTPRPPAPPTPPTEGAG